jgi:hypothetical protein
MSFGDRLKDFIYQNFENVSQFSYDFRVSAGLLHKYFRNETNPSSEVLGRLYQIGCNINWLLSGDGEMWNDTEAGRALRQKHESELLVQTETGLDKKKKK